MNMNKNWDGKTPDWELEPVTTEQKESQEIDAEAEPSVAEARVAELAAETKEMVLENPEQKAVEVEAVRAEIAEMAKSEQKPEIEKPKFPDNILQNAVNPALIAKVENAELALVNWENELSFSNDAIKKAVIGTPFIGASIVVGANLAGLSATVALGGVALGAGALVGIWYTVKKSGEWWLNRSLNNAKKKAGVE